jgi:hypothetical protein
MNKDLIQNLSNKLVDGINELSEKYQAVQMLPELKIHYPTQLRKEIVSVRMFQTENDCYLEITDVMSSRKLIKDHDPDPEFAEEEHLFKSFRTERTSLAFVAYENGLYFKPEIPVAENAYLFLEEFDDNSKLNATDLFSEEGADNLIGSFKKDA